MKTMEFTIQTVVSVYDGDTLTVVLDRGWYDYSQRDVRVNGIDAPEKKSPTLAEGVKVRDAVRAWLTRAAANGPLTLVSYQLENDKYGRVMGDVRDATGNTLSAYLLANKLAHPYAGGTKLPWTAADLAVVDAFVIPQV